MTIPLHTAGGLTTAVGHLGGTLNDANSLRGGSATTNVLAAASVATRYSTFETDFTASPNKQQLLDGAYSSIVTALQSGVGGALTSIQTVAQNLLRWLASNDQSLPTNPPALTVQQSLALLVSQMTGATNVQSSTVSAGAQTNSGSPNGNPVFVVSLLRGDGLALQLPYAETLTFTVTNDTQNGATANQEPYSVNGAAAVSDVLSQAWPGGSGVAASFTLTDATANNTGGNLLVNSGPSTFTVANNPDNWTHLTGTFGTNILDGGSSNAYFGSHSFEFVGDGATLISMKQPLNTASQAAADAGGSPAKLSPQVPYAVNLWVKMSATPAAGTLAVDLVDGSNAVVNDSQGAANTVTKVLTAVGTSWVNVNGVFRMPALLPSGYALRVRLSVAIDNGKNLFIGGIALQQMNQLYGPMGPFLAGFAGQTKVLKNDAWTVAVTNTAGKLQQLFHKFFNTGMTQFFSPFTATQNVKPWNMELPYSGSPTELDSLIG